MKYVCYMCGEEQDVTPPEHCGKPCVDRVKTFNCVVCQEASPIEPPSHCGQKMIPE